MIIRASQMGKIMTKPRTKKEVISQTALTHLQELALFDVYGYKKEFSNKYTRKGIEGEDGSILRLSEHEDNFYVKNEEHFVVDRLSGTPDILTEEEVIDVKSSWDATTFPFFDTEIKNKMYYWQLVAYMMLTGRKKARLCYVLTDTPEDIINDEIRRLSYQRFEIEVSEETEMEVRDQHDFSKIDDKLRVKSFEIELKQEDVDAVNEALDIAENEYNKIVEQFKK